MYRFCPSILSSWEEVGFNYYYMKLILATDVQKSDQVEFILSNLSCDIHLAFDLFFA